MKRTEGEEERGEEGRRRGKGVCCLCYTFMVRRANFSKSLSLTASLISTIL